MAAFMKPYSAQTFAVFRIITGLLFMSHGMQKLFGLFGGVPADAPPFVVYGAGTIEFVTGALIAVGFFTRWAAFRPCRFTFRPVKPCSPMCWPPPARSPSLSHRPSRASSSHFEAHSNAHFKE